MAIIPVIIDSRPEYLRRSGGRATLLTLPLGTGVLADAINAALGAIDVEPARVLPPTGSGRGYAATLRRHCGDRLRVLSPRELAEELESREPTDQVLAVDVRHWPVDGPDFVRLLDLSREERAALHAVAAGPAVDCAHEVVRCDDRGRVRQVRRYYERSPWRGVGAVPYSVISLAAAERADWTSLNDLRRRLANEGLATRDVAVCEGVADLCREDVYLALAERALGELAGGRTPRDYEDLGDGVLIASGARVHPQARLIGPVVVQPGAGIGAGATVIGPTVIGAGAEVAERATLAQTVVCASARVGADAVVRHAVVVGHVDPGKEPAAHDAIETPTVGVSGARAWPRGLASIPRPSANHGLSGYDAIKRLLDILVSAASIVVLSPLFLMVAVLIKLESRGRVLYGQEREGRDGRVFKCWKFRTMCEGAHRLQRELAEQNGVDGPQFKIEDDPRVTRVGRWLRTTNIDELPQLYSVLVGDMSLVGPRPSPFRENQICVPWRRARLSVRPGITGLWQVCRHARSEGDFHQWIAYDTLYVRNRSTFVDLKILAFTIGTLGGKSYVPLHWILPRSVSAGYVAEHASSPHPGTN